MITLNNQGIYKLVQTKDDTKILYLDSEAFAWVKPKHIGEILVETTKEHTTSEALATGRYFLYDVEDEQHLTDLQHLELQYGKHAWQGYLLPTGLPDSYRKRTRIIPTHELITDNKIFAKKLFNPAAIVRVPHIPHPRLSLGTVR